MLYALGDPVSLLLLLLSFVFAVTLHGWVQSVVARRHGDRAVVAERRTKPDPRRHVDPFGAVAAAIAGIGWAKPVDPPDRRRRGALVQVLLVGAVVNIAVGLGALVALGAVSGVAGVVGPSRLLQSGIGGDLGARALLLFGLANLMTGLLSLVPIPPLDGGRLLFGLAPRTPGWQKAEYQLDERNIGIAVLLALLLIPLGGPQALLPTILDTIAGPLVRLVTGG
ncbi:MAG: putative Zn-dependent rane protease [Frankiales bacterium]|nr:putative Zn-dependent rane protease [Frankiales bacterium]